MLKQSFTEHLRSKKKSPFSFLINWLGLTIGLAAVIVIYLFIYKELNHDLYFKGSMQDVYRADISKDMEYITPGRVGEYARQHIPEIISSTKFVPGEVTVGTTDLPIEQKKFFVPECIFADSTLLEVFPLQMLYGSGENALSDMGKILLSSSLAEKLFGTANIIGYPISINNRYILTVSGVFEDIPDNTSFPNCNIIANIKLFLAIKGETDRYLDSWSIWRYLTFIRLHPNADIKTVEPKFQKLIQEKIITEWNAVKYDKEAIHLVPFDDLYFKIGVNGAPENGDKDKLITLGIIALLILTIAIANYVNIYTAHSTGIIRSMGIKSIMGAPRKELIGHIVVDSTITSFLAATSAFIIAFLLQPLYPFIIGKEIPFHINIGNIFVLFIGLPSLCGFLCGIFPAMALTCLRPIDILANRSSGNKLMANIRNGLIILQFIISIGLIASTFIINKQIQFMLSMDLGYNKENVIIVTGQDFMLKKFDAFRSLLIKNSSIIDASILQSNLIDIQNVTNILINKKTKYSPIISVMWGDEHTFRVLGIRTLEGDSITPANRDRLRQGQWMVNESFAKLFRQHNPTEQLPNELFFGIFNDFHYRPLTTKTGPLVFNSIYASPSDTGDAYIRISGKDTKAALQYIEQCFSEIFPDEVYNLNFLDEKYENLYFKEKLFQSQLTTFSILAIIISCLGLFALISHSIEQHKKEIALRKVYGSSVTGIVSLLLTRFLRWILFSFIIAVPIVWYLIHKWLEQFAYHIDINWTPFLSAGGITFIIAILTVLYQSYSAAKANPIKAIKTE